MDSLLFPLVAIVLYFLSDWILQRIEIAAGRRLEHRTLVFFVIISILAVSSFSLIQYYSSAV